MDERGPLLPSKIVAVGVKQHPPTIALDQAMAENGVKAEWKIVDPDDVDSLKAMASSLPEVNGAPLLILEHKGESEILRGNAALKWVQAHDQEPKAGDVTVALREMNGRHAFSRE